MSSAMSATTTPPQQRKQYNKLQLMRYFTDESELPTPELAAEQYKICPPLRPERFRRRVKMLWGFDINEYPKNSTITISSYSELSVKYQLFNGGMMYVGNNDYLPQIPPLQDSIYSLCRQFLFFTDTSVFSRISESKFTQAEESLKLHKGFMEDSRYYKNEFIDIYDVLSDLYRSTIMTPSILFGYAEENNPVNSLGCGFLSNIVEFGYLVHLRAFDLKGDLLSLYLAEQGKTRNIWLSDSDTNQEETDIPVSFKGITLTDPSRKYVDFDMYFPWHNYNIARSFAGNLAFLLRLRQKTTNNYVIRYMSGQLDNVSTDYFDRLSYEHRFYQDSIRNLIRSNNYYGYAILREFCEDPMREMPTLEKVGRSFQGKVKGNSALLYLEPYPDSYDIDTIHPDETFKACEMGYDDYYLVEVVKPVETPFAGPGGYAVILDRTETVYGYVKASEVRKLAVTDTITPIAFPYAKKQGVINDPDGYVNIRKEMNAQSKILGRIDRNEVFTYWQLSGSGWCIVRTQNGVLGYMFSNRIVEKTGD